MKQFWIFSLWLSLASCLMGCQEDETAQTAQRWGYLSLPDVSVQVENLNLLPTRTASDEDPLTVEIRQGEEVVKSYASDALPEKIELEPGFYTLCVYNDSHGKPWVAPGTPDYFYTSENAFEIKEGETNMLETIRVPMVNFGVRLQLPDEFNTWFPNYTFTVQVGEQSVTLKDQETADLYLNLFCRKTDTARQYVQQWLPIVAASQLAKENELEKEFLMRWIDVIDYQ